jgi:NADH-quinone oxidoreductase subunit E
LRKGILDKESWKGILDTHFIEENQSMQELQSPAKCSWVEKEEEDLNQVLSRIRESFAGRSGDLISMLQAVQRTLGFLPERSLLEIARMIGVPAASVFGVATFYAQFRLQPVGKHIIRICTGTACHVRGSRRILNDVESRLHIEPEQTTSDRRFTLQTVACFGACALAPVVVVDESVNGRMNPSKILGIVKDLDVEKSKEETGSGQ